MSLNKGLEFTSNKRYEPPCRSKPKTIFFLGKKDKFEVNKLGKKNRIPNITTKIIEKIFNLEKCSTLNYFLGSVLLKTCEIVLLITCTDTFSEI